VTTPSPPLQPLPPPPPEADLIRQRREAAFLSMRQAALGAGVSPTAWAEVEAGRKKVAPGVEVAKRGTPKILAAMARRLSITPDELARAGRDDAAAYLAAILRTVESAPELTGRQRSRLTSRIIRDTSDPQ